MDREEFRKWVFEDTQPVRCHIECLLRKMNLYDDVKGPNINQIVLQLHLNHPSLDTRAARLVLLNCVEDSRNATGTCEKPFLAFKCFNVKYGTEIKDAISLKKRQQALAIDAANRAMRRH